MAGHWHDPSAATQNQGNQLGSRPCVRQSQLFRQNESGNTMKSLLGSSHLQWDTKHTQGAYDGRPAYDAHTDYMAQTSIQGKYHCARRRPNPYPRLRDGVDVDETSSSVLHASRGDRVDGVLAPRDLATPSPRGVVESNSTPRSRHRRDTTSSQARTR